jgi:hypothetical protein
MCKRPVTKQQAMQTETWIVGLLTALFVFTEFERTGDETIVAYLTVPPPQLPGRTE